MRRLDATGYDTDKSIAYLSTYEALFGALRHEPIRLLELGVKSGGSLLLWRDYFENGTIVGLDTNAVTLEDPTGWIRIFQGRQEDRTVLDAIGREAGPFDIVIDDASHVAELARISFWFIFRRYLKPGGVYVIEDWGTGYWDSWPDGHHYEFDVDPQWVERGTHARPSAGHRYGMVGLVKELIDECGMNDITNPRLGISPHRHSLIQQIQISAGQVAVIKRSP